MSRFRCGHPYTLENSYDTKRYARCRTCALRRMRIRYASSPGMRARLKARAVAWYRANPEKARQHQREYMKIQRAIHGSICTRPANKLHYALYYDMRKLMMLDGRWPLKKPLDSASCARYDRPHENTKERGREGVGAAKMG